MEMVLIGRDLKGLSDMSSDEIALLETAVSVNLHFNSLSSLQGLHSLVSLTSLNLSSNEFSTSAIPELCLLPNLTSLDLASNFLTDLLDLPFLPQLQVPIVSDLPPPLKLPLSLSLSLSSLSLLQDNVPCVQSHFLS